MASAMQTSVINKTSVQRTAMPAPFRAAGPAAPRRQRTVVTKASNDDQPAAGAMQKAVAAFAAAAVAFSPLSASATEKGNIFPQRNRAEDNAARSFLDSKEDKNPSVQSRQLDKNSGKDATAVNVGGTAQADFRKPAGGVPNKNPNAPLGDFLGSNSSSANAAKDKLDAPSAIRGALDRSEKPVSWTAPALQVNVNEQIGKKFDEGAKKAADTLKGNAATAADPKDGAKVAANALKDAGTAANPNKLQQALGQKPTAAPIYDRSALQVSVNEQIGKAFDQGAKKAADTLKGNAATAADPKNGSKVAANALKDAGTAANPNKLQQALGQKPTSAPVYDRASLQISVNEQVGKAFDQGAKKAADTLKGNAATAADPKEGSKVAANALKDAGAAANPKGLNALGQKATAAPIYDRTSLQTNVVGVFGRGEAGTFKDQIKGAKEDAKEVAGSPVQSAKNAASDLNQKAERVLSNPTGGPEQSQRAADQLSKANAEVPRALSGGAEKVKDAVTSPAAFSGFDTAALQHSAALEAGPWGLQHNVRLGDLQSITGAQAKKATPDQTSTTSDPGSGDAQTNIDESTSGVKARGASGAGKPTLGAGSGAGTRGSGAADRAEERFETEAAADATPKKSGNDGFRV